MNPTNWNPAPAIRNLNEQGKNMNTFDSLSKLRAGSREYEIYRLDSIDRHVCDTEHLPYSLRILLENLLRTENGRSVTADTIQFLAQWKPHALPLGQEQIGRAHV